MSADLHSRYPGIPELVLEALERYRVHHIPPGHFSTALLSNDLRGAIGRADVDTLLALPTICRFVYNELPWESHGSPERVARWLSGTAPAKAANA